MCFLRSWTNASFPLVEVSPLLDIISNAFTCSELIYHMVVYVKTVQDWYVSTQTVWPGDKTSAEFVQDRHFFSTIDTIIYKEKCVMKLSK